MGASPASPLRRRWLALAAGALILVSAACGSDGGSTPGPVAASGTEDTAKWSFTDDLGVTVTRDSRPIRIVAQVSAAATLYDYGIDPVGVFGPTVRKDGTPENLAGDLAKLGNLPSESFYVANPKVAVDVAWFRALGLQVPDVEVAEGEFWENLSWEQAGRHAADLIFNDIRGQSLTVEEMKKGQPTFANLPAVKAGQVGRWHFESPYSYESVADVLSDMTATIRSANPRVV